MLPSLSLPQVHFWLFSGPYAILFLFAAELKDPAEMDMSDVQKNLRSLYEYNVLLREKLVEAQSLFHSLATKSSTEGQT